MARHQVAPPLPQAIIGLLLVAAGGAMLLDRLGILHSLAQLWPVVIIGAGIALLLEQSDGQARDQGPESEVRRPASPLLHGRGSVQHFESTDLFSGRLTRDTREAGHGGT